MNVPAASCSHMPTPLGYASASKGLAEFWHGIGRMAVDG